MSERNDAWLWGWDPTPGIVSVWAEPNGRASVWRRDPVTRELSVEHEYFRPWVVLDAVSDLHGARGSLEVRELEGPGALRYWVSAEHHADLLQTVLRAARLRLGRAVTNVRELGPSSVLHLPLEEQYLVSSGRTYFKGMDYDAVRRLQFDLETTGLDPAVDRIFLIAVRAPDGSTEILEARDTSDSGEADLIIELCRRVAAHDPDVIENHNLHGFDLPFLAARANRLEVPLDLARSGPPGLGRRAAARGASLGGYDELMRRARYTVPGREFVDSLDATRRHDFSARDLPGHGLKAVARHLGLAKEDREYLPGHRVYQVFREDPARVRRYASDDVAEAAGVARLLGGSAFALAKMAPRRYERLADAGAATGVIDPLLVRAYLHEGAALPAHAENDGTEHSGAALYLFASGVAHRIVKADVASLYPSLMRQYRIGPARDRLGVMLALVDQLVEQRLAAKARAQSAERGSPDQFSQNAISAAMKLVVNSAYGYLGAVGLTRFADVHAANEVTRRGREVLALLCRELAARGVQLLEADTDGVYFAVPDHYEERDERRVVSEVAALLPALVKLEFEGRYDAMLSHEPKNYALLGYDGRLLLRGVAFRSSRAEPFGEDFLRRALFCLLNGDLLGVRTEYVATVNALRERKLSNFDVSARVRLTKTPEQYAATRLERRELPYEALLSNGRSEWSPGERVRVYRAMNGRAGLLPEHDEDSPRVSDYDVDYYLRVLHDTFAERFARAVTVDDFATLFADPKQPSLFETTLTASRPILTPLLDARELTSSPEAPRLRLADR